MDEMCLHGEGPSLHHVLAWRMEVVLKQVVDFVAPPELAAGRHVDLKGVVRKTASSVFLSLD